MGDPTEYKRPDVMRYNTDGANGEYTVDLRDRSGNLIERKTIKGEDKFNEYTQQLQSEIKENYDRVTGEEAAIRAIADELISDGEVKQEELETFFKNRTTGDDGRDAAIKALWEAKAKEMVERSQREQQAAYEQQQQAYEEGLEAYKKAIEGPEEAAAPVGTNEPNEPTQGDSALGADGQPQGIAPTVDGKPQGTAPTADVDAIAVRMREAYNAINDVFADDAEVRMAQLEENPWQVANDPTLTPEQQEAVASYMNAKAALDGVQDAATEAAATKHEEVQQQVDRRTNQQTGMIHPATLKVDDKQVYVVSGDVKMFADGTGVDLQNSSESIIVMDPETGEVKFMSPDQIYKVDDPIDPNAEVQAADAAISAEQEAVTAAVSDLGINEGSAEPGNHEGLPLQATPTVNQEAIDAATPEALQQQGITRYVDDATAQKYADEGKQELQSKAEATIMYNNGQLSAYDYLDELGYSRGEQSWLDNASDEELVKAANEEADKYEPYISWPEEENIADNADSANIADNVPETTKSVPETAENVPISQELERIGAVVGGNNGSENIPQDDNNGGENIPDEEETTSSALSRIPVDEKGTPVFDRTDPETAWDGIVEYLEDENDAKEYVDATVAQLTKEVEQAKKAVNKVKPTGDIAAYKQAKAEAKQVQAAAEARLEHWKKMAEVNGQRVYAEQQRQLEEKQRIEAERKEQDRIAHDKAVAELEAKKKADAEKQAEQEAVGTHAVHSKIKEKWDKAPKVDGAPNALTLPDGSTLRGHYVLTEAGAATASHDVNNAFAPTEGFPVDKNGQSVNDRDYARDVDAQNIVRSIAGNYDSRALQNPTVVSRDGVVLSGNNRTMSGDLAAQHGTDGAYVDHLKEYPQQFGFTKEQVDGMQHPRVHFVPDENLPYDASTFARFNAQEMKSQSKQEAAVKLGKVVSDETFNAIVQTIGQYDRMSDFYANTKDTNDALMALMKAGVVNDKQLPELRTGDQLSSAGRELLENTLIGKVFQQSPDAVRQIIAQPSVKQSVVMGLSEIAHNRTLKNGYDLSDELSAAVDLVMRAKASNPDLFKEGMPISPFGRQMGLFDEEFGESSVKDATVLTLADVLNTGKPGDLRKFLAMYNKEGGLASTGQLDIFSGDKRSKNEILTDINEQFKHATPREQQQLVDAAIAARKQQHTEAAASEQSGRGGSTDKTASGTESVGEREQSAGKSARGKVDLAQVVERVKGKLSDEVNEFGKPFIKSHNGSIDYGTIDAESGLIAAPIRLSIGENNVDEEGKNHGYGLLHIEAGHGQQIRDAGYNSVEDFVEKVAGNYVDIREGGVIAGNQTYLLELSDDHNNTLFVQLSRDGKYWNVNSAGIFKKKYSRRKPKVFTVPALDSDTSTDTRGVNRDQTEGAIATSRNSPQTSSVGKVRENTSKSQEVEREKSSYLSNVSETQEASALQADGQPQGIAPTATESSYKIVPGKYTNKKGRTSDVYRLFVGRDLTDAEKKAANAFVREPLADGKKTAKGWYDRDAEIYTLRSEEAARQLGEMLGDESGEAVADAQPVTAKDYREAVKPKAKKPAKPSRPNKATVKDVATEESTTRVVSPKAEKDEFNYTNVSREEANEALQTLRDLLGVGDDEGDPGILFADGDVLLTKEQRTKIKAAGLTLTQMLVDSGKVKFPDYAATMVQMVGNKIRPWMKSFYEGIRMEPGYEDVAFTPHDEVVRFDVENFDKPTADMIKNAAMRVAEQKAAALSEQTDKEVQQERNDKRKKDDQQREADTAAIAEEAGAVASAAQSVAAGGTVDEVADSLDKVDAALEKVNDQLALLGYYDGDGNMPRAEKLAANDLKALGKRLATDLGLDIYDDADRHLVSADLTDGGGTMRLNLPNASVTMRFEGNYGKGTLQLKKVRVHVDAPDGAGMTRTYGSEITYDGLRKALGGMIDEVKKKYGEAEKPASGSQFNKTLLQVLGFKEKHPDTKVLMLTGGNYEAYYDDAPAVGKVLNQPVSTRDGVEVVSFPASDLDTYLPKLVRAGFRVGLMENNADNNSALQSDGQPQGIAPTVDNNTPTGDGDYDLVKEYEGVVSYVQQDVSTATVKVERVTPTDITISENGYYGEKIKHVTPQEFMKNWAKLFDRERIEKAATAIVDKVGRAAVDNETYLNTILVNSKEMAHTHLSKVLRDAIIGEVTADMNHLVKNGVAKAILDNKAWMNEAVEHIYTQIENEANRVRAARLEEEAMARGTDEAKARGYKLGDKVMYKGQEATIYKYEHDGRPVLDTGMAPVVYEVAEWDDVEPSKNAQFLSENMGKTFVNEGGMTIRILDVTGNRVQTINDKGRKVTTHVDVVASSLKSDQWVDQDAPKEYHGVVKLKDGRKGVVVAAHHVATVGGRGELTGYTLSVDGKVVQAKPEDVVGEWKDEDDDWDTWMSGEVQKAQKYLGWVDHDAVDSSNRKWAPDDKGGHVVATVVGFDGNDVIIERNYDRNGETRERMRADIFNEVWSEYFKAPKDKGGSKANEAGMRPDAPTLPASPKNYSGKVVLKDGRQPTITYSVERGEQVSATQFSAPTIDRYYGMYDGKEIGFTPDQIDEAATDALQATKKDRNNSSDIDGNSVTSQQEPTEIKPHQPLTDLFGNIMEPKKPKKKSKKSESPKVKEADLFDVQPEKSAEELAGDSAERQQREQDERNLVTTLTDVLMGRARDAMDAEDVEPLTMAAVKNMVAKYPSLSDYSTTDLQELVERAMTMGTRVAARMGINGTSAEQRDAYDEIVKMYFAQPLLNARDSTRVERQQYSTPTPFGYVMGQFLQAGRQVRSMLEPSAGNGALTITFKPSLVHVNDIDDRRLANLRTMKFGRVTSQDGTLPFEGTYDAVATNPPFGSTTMKEFDGIYKISSLEGLMSINALDSMADNGRAAIIIGGNTEYRDNGAMKPKDMTLFGYLYSHYNVVDVINMDGAMYGRNGTKYPVRIILIAGRKTGDFVRTYPPVRSKGRAEQVKSFDELYNRIQDDILRLQQIETESPGNAESGRSGNRTSSAQDSDGNNKPNTEERTRPILPSQGRVENGGHQELGSQSTLSSGRGGNGATTEQGSSSRVDNDNRGDAGDSPVVRGKESRGQQRPSETPRVGNINLGDGRGSNGRVDGIRSASGSDTDRARLSVGLTDEKVAYPNRSQGATLMSVVPANQAQVLAESLESIGDVDQFLVDKLGYSSKDELYDCLAAEQIDGVALAINQMDNGNAFIIGDMTGVGKGRQAAALVRYAVHQGRKPIFFTQAPNLFSDLYRDLVDIGSSDLRPFIFASQQKRDEAKITDAHGNEVYRLPSPKEVARVFDYVNEHGTLPDEYDYAISPCRHSPMREKTPCSCICEPSACCRCYAATSGEQQCLPDLWRPSPSRPPSRRRWPLSPVRW